MKKINYILTTTLLIIIPAIIFSSCKKTLGPTKVEIEDSVRHYLPVVLGDEVRMVWVVKNVGKESLLITDVQPSNGSIEVKSVETGLVPPGGDEKLFFIFHTDKNVGYAEQKIRIFGNIEPDGVKEMRFDIHIVRPTLDRTDYEEIYFDKESDIDKESFNRGQLNRAYYTDADSSEYMDVEPVERPEDYYRTVREQFRNGKKRTNKNGGDKSDKKTSSSDNEILEEKTNSKSYVLQFKTNATVVRQDNILDEIVLEYKNNSNKSIVINGYADKETGNPNINKKLSNQRVHNVVDLLERKGVPINNIKHFSHGDSVQPFGEPEKNRCVVIKVQ